MIPAGGLGYHLANAPVTTLVLCGVNLFIRCNEHENVRGGNRLFVFGLMNVVLCSAMGLVSDAFSSVFLNIWAALMLTTMFGIKPEEFREAVQEDTDTGNVVVGTPKWLDNDIIDVPPLHNPEAVEKKRRRK